ncbi:hypothetical protein [Chitinophaga arvensicola]|uniref:T9SS C-terminal target domain-containing protein n=1 Tax=Chitinophaga arvensicola TaxID=29529 RepID=A0A1I0SC83_9BACT|nr:hypothetical protein [Chitinophaga arvensicola]SEW53326.1 hypothetical protein SAMN04488122_5418 [Chitinophaga arvensicola]
MKKNYSLLLLNLLIASSWLSCKKGDDIASHVKPVAMLPVEIKTNRTLHSDTVYTFESNVVVKDNAVLTIEPGTVIKFQKGKGAAGYFAITRGAKIIAEGTADKPIVFTSGKPAGERLHGDWVGLYIFGNAPVSTYDESTGGAGTEMSLTEAMGASAPKGGGNDPADNSGVLKYVRIEFAGNTGNGDGYGFACVGVGAGTIIENVSSSYTQVSGMGFFGGTVNARHLVAFSNRVASIIYSNGYTGKQQFVVSYKHPYFGSTGTSFISTCDALMVFNDIKGYPLTDNTRPVLSNFTVIGPYNNPGYNNALPWNAALNVTNGGAFVLRNTILMGMPKGGIKFSEDMAAQRLLNGESAFSANLVHSNIATDAFTVNPDAVYSIDAAAVTTYALDHKNKMYATPAEINLADPFNFSQPGLLPKGGEPAMSGADFDGDDFKSFFTKVNYIGAFGTENWLDKWTNFYPVSTNY